MVGSRRVRSSGDRGPQIGDHAHVPEYGMERRSFLSVHLFWRELRFRYCAARGGRSYFCRWRGDYVVYRLHDPQAASLCGHTVAVLPSSWDAMVRSRRGDRLAASSSARTACWIGCRRGDSGVVTKGVVSKEWGGLMEERMKGEPRRVRGRFKLRTVAAVIKASGLAPSAIAFAVLFSHLLLQYMQQSPALSRSGMRYGCAFKSLRLSAWGILPARRWWGALPLCF